MPRKRTTAKRAKDPAAAEVQARPESVEQVALVEEEVPKTVPSSANVSRVQEPGPVPEPEPELMEPEVQDRSLGWTEEHTKTLKKARSFSALALEVDMEVLHLVTGIGSLYRGDFDLARYNFFCAGLIVPGGAG